MEQIGEYSSSHFLRSWGWGDKTSPSKPEGVLPEKQRGPEWQVQIVFAVAQATIAKDHDQLLINNRLFLTVLDAGCPP